MLGLFKKKNSQPIVSPLEVDIHSHLLPGLDDGVKSFDESITILNAFVAMGYKKVITTPHAFADHYPNNPSTIKPKLMELREVIMENNIPIKVDAAAEYYLDENFLKDLNENKPLLTFGDNYILIETPFINKPTFLIDAVFQILAKGYRPVLAHPERYNYLYEDDALLKELVDRDVKLQININSLVGYYSRQSKKYAEKLIDAKLVSFIGSDCHNLRHLGVIQKAVICRYFKKLNTADLLNNSL